MWSPQVRFWIHMVPIELNFFSDVHCSILWCMDDWLWYINQQLPKVELCSSYHFAMDFTQPYNIKRRLSHSYRILHAMNKLFKESTLAAVSCFTLPKRKKYVRHRHSKKFIQKQNKNNLELNLKPKVHLKAPSFSQ